MRIKTLIAGIMTSCLLAACGGGEPEKIQHQAGVKQEFVNIGSGVELELLDFGGQGEVVLFLAGAGNSAHIFAEFAPRFTDRFRVLALTRRGYGASSKPLSGYDNLTLSNDIRLVLDAKGIARVNLIGHSIAGDEMTRFAENFPSRVGRLVYLDAAYDRTAVSALFDGVPIPPQPQPNIAELSSLHNYGQYLSKLRGITFPQAELKATTAFNSSGVISGSNTPDAIGELHLAGVETPNYASVKAPALGIYAVPVKASDVIPWLSPSSPDWASAQTFLQEALIPFYNEQRALFKTQLNASIVVEIAGANHYIFISHPDQVEREIKTFLGAK